MFALYVEAPFAAFRTFTAGWYRPTATFITPSAAYGLLLNLAGIESRLREGEASHPGKVPTTLTRSGLPGVELALGVPDFCIRRGRIAPLKTDSCFPRVQTILQQLHNYPVGTSGAERAESTKGNKYNITPVRREFLSELRVVLAVRGNDDLIQRVRRGIAGESMMHRYGVPFFGDNAFLIDRLAVLSDSVPVRWYERISASSATVIRERTTRLTIQIDRADLSKTTSALYAPQPEVTTLEPSSLAWTSINPPQEETLASPARKPSRRGNK